MQGEVLEKINYSAVGEIVYQTVLANGLRVFLLPKNDFNETYGIISTNFGSVDTGIVSRETKQVTQYPAGIAHFLEHKLFEGPQGKDLLLEFTKLGAESNAFTSFTRISYLFSATDNISENLQLLQELVHRADFTKESILREQDIIGQEIEMYQDNPDYRLFFGALANLYPQTPLAEDIAGTKESISEITVENLKENFKNFYHPSNMTLFVIGNFDLEQIAAEIAEQQEKLVFPGSSEPIEKIPVTLHPVVSTDTYRMEVASPKLAVGIRGTDFVDESELYCYKITLKLLFAMMFGWTSKRFQSLYESGKMDNSLTLEVEVEKDFHFVMLTMDTQEPVGLSHQFRSAIKNFDKDPDVTEEHLDTIKSEMFGDFLHGLNSLEYIATQYEPYLTGENLFDLPKILQDISLNDVIKLGHRFIDQCDMTDFTIFPK
ncbi:insulinase family protein [Streptococcus sanguinis]|uniref:EF-P 5-aminopentanol modification-associated protein YfmH n=1 Tax=Streptococcus sanguinis TaxID=1305 RepID=UPI001CBB82A8|nr:pitrilysin family protein [Streptococcus sanguinis]MBZ2024277.1 insulinase family protein [Streptococcus sanguinis]MBZ2048866.1 insulinase family protein [Streptococcus sanguinis]MBZ2051591.1 insulinase family protein [Streptococcus sanguinis]MBZ2060544.1 insulinase family protein [Streptococcus sanguinis]MCC3176490.1 insulinase family protein [Streptococcus sanguinis]